MIDRRIAAALETARANGPMFGGGMPYSDAHTGYIHAPVPGRTDKIDMKVPAGAYVIPADIVSGKGEGNSLAGAKFFESWLGAPYGAKVGKPKRAAGGMVGSPVQIVAAGGEFVVPPEKVQELGHGDISKGHDYLDRFVKTERAKLIKTLRKLPGPVKT